MKPRIPFFDSRTARLLLLAVGCLCAARLPAAQEAATPPALEISGSLEEIVEVAWDEQSFETIVTGALDGTTLKVSNSEVTRRNDRPRTHLYNGTITIPNPQPGEPTWLAMVTLVSDDGCNATIDGRRWLAECGHGHDISRGRRDCPRLLSPGRAIPVKIIYSQAYYNPRPGTADLDGISLILRLLPIDIDFVHPATGEMNESRETSEGGYIAIRKDEETPVTKLKLHKLEGMASAEFKLTFSSSKIKIWKDTGRTQAVTSDSTVFPANVDTELFLEGVEKSTTAKDIEIGLKVKIGSTESSAVTTKATVVQSEYKTTIQAFIPYLWIDVPLNWTPLAWDEVAVGDNRPYDPTLNQTYRARQTFTVTPFEDLTTDKIKPDSIEGDAGLSIHYDKSDSVPVNEQGQAHGNSFDGSPVETRRGQGTVDIPTAGNVQPIDSKRFTFQAHMAAWEGVIGQASEPIVWNVTFGFDVRNPVLIRVLASGTRKGFPAYEIYISNSEDENIPIYQWTPEPERYIIPHLFMTEPITPDQPLELLVP